MIGVGVHLYVYLYVCDPPKFEWHFSGRLTFSNFAVDFPQIYKLALLLHVPEKLFVLKDLLFNVHLVLFICMMMQYGHNGKDRHNSHTLWFRVHFSEHVFSCLLLSFLLL